MSATHTKDNPVIHQNISYYDEIAHVYDQVMDADRSNELVRKMVREKMRRVLQSGWVIDFGGGTGLDLEWLSQAGYHIIFCEPSEAMREKAIALNNTTVLNQDIHFLDAANTDFMQWRRQPPFHRKADALIANFGVINYIPDLKSLFQNLAAALKPGAHVLLVTLKLSLRQRLRWHRRNALKSLFFRIPFVMYITYNTKQQTVFVHSEKEIRKAAAQHFEFRESQPVTGFTFIHLTRR
jgi:SAM-dependent methyltransferase